MDIEGAMGQKNAGNPSRVQNMDNRSTDESDGISTLLSWEVDKMSFIEWV